MAMRFVLSSALLLSISGMLGPLDVKAQSSDQASSGGSIFSIVQQRSNGNNKNANNNANNNVQNNYNNSVSPGTSSGASSYGSSNYGGNSFGTTGGAGALGGGGYAGGNSSGGYGNINSNDIPPVQGGTSRRLNRMPAVAPPAASGASANSSGSYTFGGNQNVNPVRQTEAPPAVAQPQFQKTFQDSSSSTISGDRWGLSTNFPIPMKASDIDQFSEVYDSPGYHQNTNHDELQKVRDFYGIK